MRAQSLWDGSADYILALLEDMAGLGAVARFLFRRKEPEYLWFGIAMLFNSVGKLAGPIFYQRLFQASWSRLLEIGIALIIADLVIGLVYTLSGFTAHIWLLNILAFVCGLPITVWIVRVLLVNAWKGSPDARLLLIPQFSYTALFLISVAALLR